MRPLLESVKPGGRRVGSCPGYVLLDSHIYCLTSVPLCAVPLSPCLWLSMDPAVTDLNVRTAPWSIAGLAESCFLR